MLTLLVILTFIAISAGLAWYLIAHDHGEREPVTALWSAFGFGFLGGIMAILLEHPLPVDALDGKAPLATVFWVTMAVGVIEEACKFLPLALCIYRKSHFNELTDGVIYFALAGLGFGLPENILYSIGFGSGTGLLRIVLTPFFHAATTAFIGYYLIRCKIYKQRLGLAATALVAAMLLHGIYDFGLASSVTVLAIVSLFITVGMSIYLFILYLHAGEADAREGRSSVGHNSFCRTCGLPNPGHHLYCTRCGNYA